MAQHDRARLDFPPHWRLPLRSLHDAACRRAADFSCKHPETCLMPFHEQNRGQFLGRDFIAAIKENYPDLLAGDAIASADAKFNVDGVIRRWCEDFDKLGVDATDRFQPLSQRPWTSMRNVWIESGPGGDLRKMGACGAYKGLILLKPAIDLVLYSNLIWELAPRTVIEFGSLQGGSAVWFADQLDALCGHGVVHSFELWDKCIHPSAVHPRVTFHHTDLNDLGSLDEELFQQLPHPWLVIDDAHANLKELIPFVAHRMSFGDYYVIEDAFLAPNAGTIAQLTMVLSALGLMVDTKYTDAFGTNVTCSVNGWLVKRPKGPAPVLRHGGTPPTG
jgi:cephalosporin hydroxylase